MATKCMKKCPTSLVIRESLIKSKPQWDVTSWHGWNRKYRQHSPGQPVEKVGHPYIASQGVKPHSNCLSGHKNLNVQTTQKLHYWVLFQQNENVHSHKVCTWIFIPTFSITARSGKTQISFNRWMIE